MKVAVAMSGGVDSTVAAILLKAQGCNLIGVFMHNWDTLNEEGHCSSQEDYKCVQDVCSKLNMPCKKLDFVKEYWNNVFGSYLDGLSEGLNLNPDLLCNQKIKFSALFKHLTRTLGVDRVATGHYARLQHMDDGSVKMLEAVDRSKDQTFFLSLVPQWSLRRALFPVGHMTKDAVRGVAHSAGFSWIARKKESYGLCFVGKRNKFTTFLSNYLEEQDGEFVTLEGNVIGYHKGHQFYTIGQRASLAGYALPHYVASKCPQTNTVTVVEGPTHPALYTCSFLTSSPHWICKSHDLRQCSVRINHQDKLTLAQVVETDWGQLKVITASPLRAVTPGQHAVFYSGEECLGAAQIIAARPAS